MIPFIDLATDKKTLREVARATNKVFASKNYILGEYTERFEQKFAKYLGCAFAVGVGSGTDALRLALRALGVGQGDRVLTTIFTSPFTALAIIEEGAIPVFCDIDERTWTISTDDAQKKIGEGVKAMVPVHIYGNPCDMWEILKFAQRFKIKVIEDASQAHGATLGGKKLGSFGNAGAFSFYPTKNLGAYGDGGVVTTNDRQLATMLKYLRNGGQTKKFWHQYRGVNSRLDELQAAILEVKLKHLSEANKKRHILANRYKEKLSGLPIGFQGSYLGAKTANHLFVVRVTARNHLKKYLQDRGVGCDIYYPWPLDKMPIFKTFAKGSLPIAEKINREILALPLYPTLSIKDQDIVIKTINEFYSKNS